MEKKDHVQTRQHTTSSPMFSKRLVKFGVNSLKTNYDFNTSIIPRIQVKEFIRL